MQEGDTNTAAKAYDQAAYNYSSSPGADAGTSYAAQGNRYYATAAAY